MNERFFPELARRLRQKGVTTGPVEKNCLTVLLDGQDAVWVGPQGHIVLAAGEVNDPKADLIYEAVRRWSAPVYEYTNAMAFAPVLEAVGLHEEFRLLAEYDGVLPGQLRFHRPAELLRGPAQLLHRADRLQRKLDAGGSVRRRGYFRHLG